MFDVLRFLFELFVGAYASTASAVFGLLGAFAFAKAPMESLGARKALFQVLGLAKTISEPVLDEARTALIHEAEGLLESERRWNMHGAWLLILSFSVLIANSIYSSMSAQAGLH
jgi:hypothetical protein